MAGATVPGWCVLACAPAPRAVAGCVVAVWRVACGVWELVCGWCVLACARAPRAVVAALWLCGVRHVRHVHTLVGACRGRRDFLCVCQVLLMRGALEEALDMLDAAARLEPKNVQTRFQRANVLMAMDRCEVRGRGGTASVCLYP